MSGYVLHPEAYIDIDELWEFIAQDNLDAADRVREEIYETIQALIPFPHQGHRRPDLTSRPVRFTQVRDFLIAYAPDENPLLSSLPSSMAAAIRVSWPPSCGTGHSYLCAAIPNKPVAQPNSPLPFTLTPSYT
jgi:plasmid stabilization system protein ParE